MLLRVVLWDPTDLLTQPGVVDRQTLVVPLDRSLLEESATRALAARLGPVDVRLGDRLPSSDRAVVARALARDENGREHAVVLKQFNGGDGGVREEAALRLAETQALPGVVRLLGTSDDPPLLVTADLGSGPALADRLLGNDASAAESAVLAWAGAVGSLQAASVGLRERFADELAALSPLGAPPLDTMGQDLRQAAVVLARELPRLGVEVPDRALGELRDVAEELDVTAAGRRGGLVPGDTCPSNAIETDSGLVLLDFEGAEWRHVAWEAAYLTVPWPSCWCSWRLPTAVTAAALERWRQAVTPALPEVATDQFQEHLARATIGWVFISASWFLAVAMDGDPPPPDPARRRLVPTRRALLQHRLFLAAERATDVLPALSELAAASHEATLRRWGAEPLALAAAFR